MIGIFDIGTKAVRLLVGNHLSNPESKFDFSLYRNFGKRTFMGEAIDDGKIKIQEIEQTIKAIIEFREEGKKLGVEKFIAVGTAVFRDISNQKEVINLIKDRTDIDIIVLTREEEAKLSMVGAIYSSGGYLKDNDCVVLIDQGGGSTEISFCQYDGKNNFTFKSVESLNLGSVYLKNELFSNSDVTFANMYEALLENAKKIIESHKKFKTNSPIKAFGLGSGITNMISISKNKRGNKRQHGIELTAREIQLISNIIYDRFSLFKNETIKSFKELYNKNPNKFDEWLTILFGYVAYKGILDYYKIKSIKVCGTGLRYGVLFSKLYELKK